MLRKEETRPKLLVEKLDAVGGNTGYLFDSGCNMLGVRAVHIQFGLYPMKTNHYRQCSAIKRIFFEFANTTGMQQYRTKVPSYTGLGVCGQSVTATLDIDPDDCIVKVDVWATPKDVVNAVQFRMKSGSVSELYGWGPDVEGCQRTTFKGTHPGSNLVGVHGRFQGVIFKLGFTFAAPAAKDIADATEESESCKEDIISLAESDTYEVVANLSMVSN